MPPIHFYSSPQTSIMHHGMLVRENESQKIMEHDWTITFVVTRARESGENVSFDEQITIPLFN
jgi:hypothetical protein